MNGNIIIDGMDGQHNVSPLCITRDNQSDSYQKMLTDLNHDIAMVIWRSAGSNSHLYFNPERLVNS